MYITYSARNVRIKESFKAQAEQRLKKLDRFFGEEVEAGIKVSVLPRYQKVEITVRQGGFLYRTEQEAPEMEKALDEAAEKLFRQIAKNKSKLVKKGLKNAGGEIEIPEEEDFRIVRTKRFAVKPMSAEEAVLQMNQLGHSFFLFEDQENGDLRVVYRRNDGDYAILVPENL